MVFPARTEGASLERPAPPPAAAALRPDFRRLVGEAAWLALSSQTRARFDAASHRVERRYRGAMEVRMSGLGWLFAQLCRLVGTPLAPWPGDGVPVTVSVRPLPSGAVLWERTYAYPGRSSLAIASQKEASPDGSLLEVTRGGLGMRLAVTAEAGALWFRSTAYFWRVGPVRLPIPLILTPGRACIVHRDLGGGRFHFSLNFVHPLAGETFSNAGDFQDPAPAARPES